VGLTKNDTAGEVIFAEASQSADQLVEWVPSVGSGLFQTSPAVSKMTKTQDVVARLPYRYAVGVNDRN
jgi:hypothetical protein